MTVLSCYLAWIGEYVTPLEALMHVCEKRGLPMEHVIVASQSRCVVLNRAFHFTRRASWCCTDTVAITSTHFLRMRLGWCGA